MPRTNLGKPSRQANTEEMIRSENPATYLCTSDIGKIIGTSDYPIIREFMRGFPYIVVGKSNKWRREDVARAICRSEVMPSV